MFRCFTNVLCLGVECRTKARDFMSSFWKTTFTFVFHVSLRVILNNNYALKMVLNNNFKVLIINQSFSVNQSL
jgi:hypothetical protein